MAAVTFLCSGSAIISKDCPQCVLHLDPLKCDKCTICLEIRRLQRNEQILVARALYREAFPPPKKSKFLAVTLTTDSMDTAPLQKALEFLLTSKMFGVYEYHVKWELQPESGFPHVHVACRTYNSWRKEWIKSLKKKNNGKRIDIETPTGVDACKYQNYCKKTPKPAEIEFFTNLNLTLVYNNAAELPSQSATSQANLPPPEHQHPITGETDAWLSISENSEDEIC